MKRILGIFVFTLLLGIVLSVAKGDAFLSEFNVKNLVRLISFLSILAIGEAIVIVTGGIDLSVGSIVGIAGVLVAYFISPATGEQVAALHGMNPLIASFLVVGLMLIVGVVQGQMITRLNLQPFVVTLGGLMILRGAGQIITHGGAVSIGEAHDGFRMLGGFIGGAGGGKNFVGMIPIPALILVVIATAAHFLMQYTVFGRHLYALGRNEEAARFSGINTARLKRTAYIISAGLAGLTGILYASYLSSVQPSSLGNAFELYAIAAAVLGGCSLRGGEGTIPGIIIGAILMRMITNGINLLGISSFWEQSVTGLVILAAALLDAAIYSKGRSK